MNPVSARLLNQQLISPLFTAPHEVVRWMGAMQGQDYRMMRWAVGMRTRKPSARAFEQDFNSGRIVRVHLFRTTWQLVAGEDLRWMLGLCRTHALRGLAGWLKHWRAAYTLASAFPRLNRRPCRPSSPTSSPPIARPPRVISMPPSGTRGS